MLDGLGAATTGCYSLLVGVPSSLLLPYWY